MVLAMWGGANLTSSSAIPLSLLIPEPSHSSQPLPQPPVQCPQGMSFKKSMTCSSHHPELPGQCRKACTVGKLSGWRGLCRVKARQPSHHCGLSSKDAGGLQVISSPELSQLFSFNILCFFKTQDLFLFGVVTSYVSLWFRKHAHWEGSGV